MNSTISQIEYEILRELAKRVADIAALPVQVERVRSWKKFNSLMPERPMVMAHLEVAWRELIPEATLQCTDQLLRSWEMMLRKTIYHFENICDDQPVTDFFNIGWVIEMADCGKENNIRIGELGTFGQEVLITTIEDLDKVRIPRIKVNRQETARQLNMAQEILGDILKVRIHGPLWRSLGLTSNLIMLRGLEQVMRDMYENPELLHRIMSLLRDDALHVLETYEKEGILSLNCGPDDIIRSAGVGTTDELPASGFSRHVRMRDMWVVEENQEFARVGADQFYEFCLQYQLPILNRFGLICYGCGEPMDSKFDLIIKNIRRLRRVLVSSSCDRRVAAQKLGNRYIYSWQPNPATICGSSVNYHQLEHDIRETLKMAKGCCVEFIMKDAHTFNGDIQRITRWCEIASRLAKENSES